MRIWPVFFRISPILALVLGIAWIPACGPRQKNINALAANTKVAGDQSNCVSRDDCPAAAAAFVANTAPGGVLVGWTGQSVGWEIRGLDTDTKKEDGTSSARRMAILLDKLPTNAKFTPAKGQNLTTSARIEWIPEEEASGNIHVIVRDMERCQMENKAKGNSAKKSTDDSEEEQDTPSKKSAVDCHAYKFLEDYDTRFTDLQWAVKDQKALAESVANGTLAGAVQNPDCVNGRPSSSQITQQALGTFIQALSGPAGLFNVGVTLFSGQGSGGIGGLGTKSPNC